MSGETCCAVKRVGDWHTMRCGKPGIRDRGGRPLCGIHARQWDRWDAEGRARSMAEFWWKWRAEVQGEEK